MLFFELLQIAIGNRDRFSQTPTVEEWRDLFSLSQKQAMVGIAFRGVEQLPEEQRPPKTLLMQWYMATERIKSMNADLSRKVLAVTNKFLEEGFPSVILKGQGIAQLYIVNGRKTTVNGIQSTVDSQREVPQEATQATINTFQVGNYQISILNSLFLSIVPLVISIFGFKGGARMSWITCVDMCQDVIRCIITLTFLLLMDLT